MSANIAEPKGTSATSSTSATVGNQGPLQPRHWLAESVASTVGKYYAMCRADAQGGPKSLLVRCMVNVSSRNWHMRQQSRLNVARNARIGCRLVKVWLTLI